MRKSVVAAWALTAALLVAAGGVARAQAQQGPSPSQKWRPTPLNLDAGKTTYGDIGRARMRAGDCAGAIDAFDEAINHSIDPTLYRDRGLCHEKLGHPYPAIDDYQVYLTASPDAPDADDIRIRLRRLLDKVNGRTTSDEDEDETPSSGGASATASGQTSGGSSSSSGSSGGSASASAKVDVKAATHRRASEGDEGGSFEFGLRSGYAIPFGNVVGGASNANLSNLYNGAIPIWVDLGYRMVAPSLYIGFFGQYGIALINGGNGQTGTGCNAGGVSCTGSVIVIGADVHYHILPDATFDPWIGGGIGWEFANISVSQNSFSAGLNFSGPQFIDLQLGGDYRVSPSFGLGPFVTGALGAYTDCGISGTAAGGSCNIDQKAVHGWLTFGLRAIYDAGF